MIEYEITEAGSAWEYVVRRGPEIITCGYRGSKGAAIEAAREDAKLAKLFF